MKRSPLRRKTRLASVSSLPQKSKKKQRAATTEQRAKAIVRVRCAALNGQMCEVCGHRQADDPAHRLASSRGGEWRASNLLALCRLCHDQQRDGKGGEQLATALGQVLPAVVGGERPDPEQVRVQTVYGRVLLTDDGDVIPVGADELEIEVAQ